TSLWEHFPLYDESKISRRESTGNTCCWSGNCSPSFYEEEKIFEIAETTPPGKRFQLPTVGDDKVPLLVLQKLLDREKNNEHKLVLTAFDDCGQPPLSTFRTLSVDVSDVNDNKPEFSQNPMELYLTENNIPGNSIFYGTIVGNVAKDLGLEITSLPGRQFRVVSESEDAYFGVNQDNGDLYVLRKIDREELCQGSGVCLMELKIIVENPLEIHYVAVEIRDVNDHSPVFPETEQRFKIGEQTLPGRRFQLHEKIPFLVLKKPLDREMRSNHLLYVTALDGGKPQRSGTLNISVTVLDSNDNRPKFSQEVYQIEIEENAPIGISIFKVNATDPDEGLNCQLEYSLGKTLKKKVYDNFDLDKITGEIRVKGGIDYEENDVYKLDIEASDKGTPPLTGECRLVIKIKDLNDNPPEIEITSLSNTVCEDSKPGTMISLISVKDKDSGLNGKVLSSITSDVPFELKPSYKENIYSVVTKTTLDRENISHYEITIKASDCGEPPLTNFKTLHIKVTDINDNPPRFLESPINVYLTENNLAGSSIFSVSATDRDVNANAAISYYIMRKENQKDVLSFLNVNSENGQITALKSFDFETLKTFQFQVVASDSGSPSLSSEVTDHSLFGLDRYTGQIRTLRSFTETDEAEHKLLILVKDNGNVSLSATATVIVKVVEPKEAFAASDVKSSAKDDEETDVTFYLMITLGSVTTSLSVFINKIAENSMMNPITGLMLWCHVTFRECSQSVCFGGSVYRNPFFMI
uniref:Si:ch73-379j16.2 n=1 Tax=Nothobranchius furzeri TaxID=105023 RepID=A0A8C6KB21_NOTFU